MTDSSDDEWNSQWVPYSERSEWSDVTPVAQDDGPNPIVAIAYSAKFREVFDYFRAILANNEKSLRALELTRDALELNPANYTVWQYRRDILLELKYDLNQELEYTEEIIRENAKNYQVWHHRRSIVEMLQNGSRELSLTEMALENDAKNYHAWQHRQWAMKKFDLFENELAYVDRLIAEDIRNNSAWNQRFFVLKHFGFTSEVIQREVQYTMNRIRVVKNNESAWNYLVGVLRESETGLLTQYPEAQESSEELYNSGVRSPYLLSFLIDVYQEQCLNSDDPETQTALARKVYGLCDQLSQKHDVIRRKYWKYIADIFEKNLKKLHSKQT